MAKLVWRVKLVAELRAGVTTEVEVGRLEHVVLEHWNGYRRNSRKMFQDLQRRGYRGSYPTLARYLRRLRVAEDTVGASGQPASARPKLDAAPRKVLHPEPSPGRCYA